MKYFSILPALLLLGLMSCVSAPSEESLRQKAVAFLGATQPMGAPTASDFIEPTGLRWTIYRAQVSADKAQFTKPNDKNLPDAPMGILFGHGLFLDSKDNLSILPIFLFGPERFSTGMTFDAQVDQEIWSSGQRSSFTGLFDTSGIQVTARGLVNSQTVFAPGKTTYEAMGRKTGVNDDGAYWESSAFPLLDVFHKYEAKGGNVKHTRQMLGDTVVNYRASDTSVAASNDSLVIKNEGDHWSIRLVTPDGPRTWLLYATADKAILIDTLDGDTATVEAKDTSVTMVTKDSAQPFNLKK